MRERIGIIGATGWLGSALVRHGLDRGVIDARGLVLLNRSGLYRSTVLRQRIGVKRRSACSWFALV